MDSWIWMRYVVLSRLNNVPIGFKFVYYNDKNYFQARNWILPPDFDHAEAESRHLIYEADTDADQKLTKYEILEKYDIFVGSQVADFGEALTRHDEF